MPIVYESLGHSLFQYTTDNGTKVTLSQRTTAQADIATGLGAAIGLKAVDGTETGEFKGKGWRHIWCQANYADGTGVMPKRCRRRYAVQAFETAPGVGLIEKTFTTDGLLFTVTGTVGEKVKGGAPTTVQ